jgi:phosphate transport system protein
MSTGKDHIIKSYDAELGRLTGEIVRMGELAVTQLEAAIDVLERRDERAAQHVVANDEAIDQLEQAISHDVVRLLALRAPMAGDLRNVFAALRIASDIERIGDYAANVAKRSIPLSMAPPVAPTGGLRHLAEMAATATRDVLAAYRDGNVESAYRVWKNDVVLDEAYTGYFRELLTYMMEDPRNITPCTHLLFMAKNIERIGDHATNIAENTWFQVTG